MDILTHRVPAPDVDAVSALLAEAARDIILPRFRRLADGDVERKQSASDPNDIVTVVDREVEAALERRLLELVRGSSVIGEEAAHADATVLERLQDDAPVWLLDPIDGTRNFVAGDESFGIMLGYAVEGRTHAGWILFPVREQLFVAESGAGSFLNGERVARRPAPLERAPLGVLHTHFMPQPLRARTLRAAEGRYQAAYDARCAAVEYTEILRADRDFAVYYRLLPWDHAAPALILAEGGGVSVHLDGRPYSPRSVDQPTIVAGDGGIAATVRAWFADADAGAGPSR